MHIIDNLSADIRVCARSTCRVFWGTLLLGAGLVGAQDVVLTPKTVVEFAQQSNTRALLAERDVREKANALDGVIAAFKPRLSLRAGFTHMDEPTKVYPGFDLSGIDTTGATPLFQSFVASLSEGVSNPIQVSPQNIFDVGYTVTQPIFTSGRLLNAYRAARLTQQGAEVSRRRVNDEVRLGALTLYWNYVAARQRVRTLQESVEWVEQLTDDVIAMVDAGVAIEEEMHKMKTQRSLARLAVVRAQNALVSLGERMLVYCNLPIHSRIVIDTIALDILEQDPDLDSLSTVTAGERSDIRAMELQIDALEALRRGQVSNYLPALMGVFNQDFTNTDPENFERLENVWNVGVALEWNLIDWGAKRSERTATTLAISRLRLLVDARKRGVRAEIAAARRRLSEALEAQQLALESVDNAQLVLRSADARYREGLITGADLLSSRRDLTHAQQELITSRIDKMLAFEEYRVARGE